MIISTPRDAAELFRSCFAEASAEGESLAVAFLDEGKRLIELLVLPPEAADRVDLPVRMIVTDALRLDAQGIVIGQHSPDRDVAPTEDDIESTRDLQDTAARLGIRLHDHLIFGREGDVLSLRGMGLL